MNDQIQMKYFTFGVGFRMSTAGGSQASSSVFILINVAYNIECLHLDCIDWKLILVRHKAFKLKIDMQMVSSNPGGFLIMRRIDCVAEVKQHDKYLVGLKMYLPLWKEGSIRKPLPH